MQRRYFIGLLGLLGLSGASVYSVNALQKLKYWPDDHTFFNPCLNSQLPPELAKNPLILSAFKDIDTQQIWDGHLHLIGLGDTDSGIWVNPHSFNPLFLKKYVQFRFFLNATCPHPEMPVDEGFINRLVSLHWGNGVRFLLLAFDYSYNRQGKRLVEQTAFYTPNEYAANIHKQWPHIFEWLASIHPYRQDCIEALEQAVANGARGVKWLPPAMGINPASPLCDRFYKKLAHWDLPLLCHSGDEQAVEGTHNQALGNPLLLRRALDYGVKVVVAHCASLGQSRDIDKGHQTAPLVANFDLFTRLLNEPAYQGRIFGDISAMMQIKRIQYLEKLLIHQDWHSQLLYGSDYPLPAVIPLTSLKLLHKKQFISAEHIPILSQLRQHNALLFDFVLARHVQAKGLHFQKSVFHTRPFWTGTQQKL